MISKCQDHFTFLHVTLFSTGSFVVVKSETLENLAMPHYYKQLKLVNSNSLNSNFRITQVFPPVPTFFLHKVTKFTSDNSRFQLTRGDFFVPRP